MQTTLEKKEKKTDLKKEKLLKALVYEMVNGKPIYYRGYQKVLKGEIPLEGVMGSGVLQATLIALILRYLFQNLPKDYIALTNELGFFTSPKGFRSLDIAVYRREDIKKPSKGYAKKPPIAVIEIDTKADLSDYENFEAYMYEKTQELLDAGVKKVVWYITKVKKVLVAEKGKYWITADWDFDVGITEEVKLNLEKLLKEEGVEI